MKIFLTRLSNLFHDRRFFWGVVIFFVIESAWIALSAVYPQAFDEDFHFGLIKLYSHYWLPFFGSQPPNANAFGAAFRDPSYLYHYIMSFPYRLIALVVHGQAAQVVIMRFLNIALAATGLILFRKVLTRAGVSQALTNICLLLYVLIPIVPQLAGQINYDNLLLPLVAWTCLLTMRATDELQTKRPSARTFLTLASVCVFTSLVKYEFLPIAVGVVLFLAYMAFQNFRGKWRLAGERFAKSWQRLRWPTRAALVLLLLLGISLFLQRDGINLVKYHTLDPDCGNVLTVQDCNAYSPWNANYYRHQDVLAKQAAGTPYSFDNPVQYTGSWFYWLWYRLFFAVNGPASRFKNYPPLPLPTAASLIVVVLGAIALVRKRKVLLDKPYFLFFGVVIFVYLAALWLEGYMQYRYTHTLVLMNGRYLLPILLLAAALIARPIATMMRHAPTLKISLAALTLLLFIEGGGVFTFIMRSNNTWDWPNSPAVHINNGARDALRPVILSDAKGYSTHVWFFN